MEYIFKQLVYRATSFGKQTTAKLGVPFLYSVRGTTIDGGLQKKKGALVWAADCDLENRLVKRRRSYPKWGNLGFIPYTPQTGAPDGSSQRNIRNRIRFKKKRNPHFRMRGWDVSLQNL